MDEEYVTIRNTIIDLLDDASRKREKFILTYNTFCNAMQSIVDTCKSDVKAISKKFDRVHTKYHSKLAEVMKKLQEFPKECVIWMRKVMGYEPIEFPEGKTVLQKLFDAERMNAKLQKLRGPTNHEA